MKIINFIFALLISTSLFGARGEVVIESDDDYIIETDNGYTVHAEWWGGSPLSEGDDVIGDLTSYGFKDVYNKSTGSTTRIYVEDYN